MSVSDSGKMVLVTPSMSPIPQIVQLIARLVREDRLDDVENILMSIEHKLRSWIGDSFKLEPREMHLEEKLHKSEKECEDLKAKNAKLMDTINEYDKIVCELKRKVSENEQTLDMYQEKIKVYDQRLTKMNMEAFDLWEKRSETVTAFEQMKKKLCEAQKNNEMLRHKLFETKAAFGRKKRKLPEPDQGVEMLKSQNVEARRMVETLSRRNLEANIAMKKLKMEKQEADKILDIHKKWFVGFAPWIKNVGDDVGFFLKEMGKNSGASGSGGDGHRF